MVVLAYLFGLALLPSGVLSLWPIPKTLETGSSALKLSPSFDIEIDFWGAPSDLEGAVSTAKSYLFNDKLGPLEVGRGSSDASAVSKAPYIETLKLSLTEGASVETIAKEAVKALGSRSEEYTLSIPSGGSAATITANSTLGLYRGLTTFTQLWYYYNGDIYTVEAPIEITDYPAYPYRGFMLDTARNYFPVTDIYRTLDAMSWAKINTFHWHIVDSQSFPYEIKEFPELAANGAYSSDEVYTADNVADIISYAGARGIDVLMEIDSPGHTTAIGATYPDYIACFDSTPWATYANEPPAGQLRLANTTVQDFAASLFSAVAKTLPSTMMSTGGDEVNTYCYESDYETMLDLNTTGLDLNGALNEFVMKTHAALEAEGKTPVVWEEMVLDFNITLSNETIVMVWISSSDAAAVADAGFRMVHSPSDYFYLDCGGGGWVGDDPNGDSWCDPFKTWQYAYTFDPLANLSEDQYDLVLGGQQLLWTEQSGPENLDPIVWPRAAASAEVFWSAGQPGGIPLNGTEALPRLHDWRYRAVQRGVNAINLQPQWCALRPDACDLYA